jgi:hypothetical protein
LKKKKFHVDLESTFFFLSHFLKLTPRLLDAADQVQGDRRAGGDWGAAAGEGLQGEAFADGQVEETIHI